MADTMFNTLQACDALDDEFVQLSKCVELQYGMHQLLHTVASSGTVDPNIKTLIGDTLQVVVPSVYDDEVQIDMVKLELEVAQENLVDTVIRIIKKIIAKLADMIKVALASKKQLIATIKVKHMKLKHKTIDNDAVLDRVIYGYRKNTYEAQTSRLSGFYNQISDVLHQWDKDRDLSDPVLSSFRDFIDIFGWSVQSSTLGFSFVDTANAPERDRRSFRYLNWTVADVLKQKDPVIKLLEDLSQLEKLRKQADMTLLAGIKNDLKTPEAINNGSHTEMARFILKAIQ